MWSTSATVPLSGTQFERTGLRSSLLADDGSQLTQFQKAGLHALQKSGLPISARAIDLVPYGNSRV